MRTIEIDFEVYKELTIRRATEEVTFNDVIRELLKLKPVSKENKQILSEDKKPWIYKGVSFPHGTEFRGTYKGEPYSGKVIDGGLVVDGQRFNSPSAAAVHITGTSVNGWIFWQCKFPNQNSWQYIVKLRK